MRLLLASGSETRRRMLEAAGVPFEVQAPDVDEAAAKDRLVDGGASATEVAAALAELKAGGVAAADDRLVIGSDQVLERPDAGMLSKARTREEAAEQLLALAGTTHRLHSAAALAQEGRIVWRGSETVSLRMRSFSRAFLEDYLEREWAQVRYSVGCYRIEGLGVQLFDRIEGSHFAILGMPLLPLLAELRRRGVLTS